MYQQEEPSQISDAAGERDQDIEGKSKVIMVLKGDV